jgi:hypothetical protein
MFRFPVFILSLWLITLGAAEAGCTVPRFSFHLDQTSDAQMYVTRGSACSINVHAGGRSRFDGISILARPQNGTVGTRSVGVTYRPKPGFAGQDSFVFAVMGQFAGGAGKATIRVSVKVQ